MLTEVSQRAIQAIKPVLITQVKSFSVIAPILSAAQLRRHKKVYDAIEQHTATLKSLDGSKNSSKQASKVKTQLKNLHAKELEALKKLNKKHSDAEKNVKAKSKVAYSVMVKEATRHHRPLTSMNAFVKSNAGSGKDLKTLIAEWNDLTESEKEHYNELASELNAEIKKTWPVEPKRPASAYASFVKQEYPIGLTLLDASKELSSRWKNLSEAEKLQYKPSEADVEKWSAEHNEWKKKRIETYLNLKAKN